MVWVKREGIQSKESGIYDGFFEGSVIARLVSKYIVVESGIRYGIF